MEAYITSIKFYGHCVSVARIKVPVMAIVIRMRVCVATTPDMPNIETCKAVIALCKVMYKKLYIAAMPMYSLSFALRAWL